ncbi:hypothetical protein RsTz2092_06240 [Deferribacterales bacterium RsTz2092]|nr:hypothetical protein AGMMS49941_12780 [Deferribacterales bacterium]
MKKALLFVVLLFVVLLYFGTQAFFAGEAKFIVGPISDDESWLRIRDKEWLTEINGFDYTKVSKIYLAYGEGELSLLLYGDLKIPISAHISNNMTKACIGIGIEGNNPFKLLPKDCKFIIGGSNYGIDGKKSSAQYLCDSSGCKELEPMRGFFRYFNTEGLSMKAFMAAPQIDEETEKFYYNSYVDFVPSLVQEVYVSKTGMDGDYSFMVYRDKKIYIDSASEECWGIKVSKLDSLPRGCTFQLQRTLAMPRDNRPSNEYRYARMSCDETGCKIYETMNLEVDGEPYEVE